MSIVRKLKATLSMGMPTNAMMPMQEVDHGTIDEMMAALFSRSRASALSLRSTSSQSWRVSMMATTWSQATVHVAIEVASTLMNGVERRAMRVTYSCRPTSRPVPEKSPEYVAATPTMAMISAMDRMPPPLTMRAMARLGDW